MSRIKFNSFNESQTFTVGSDIVFLRRENDGHVVVVRVEDGDPYPNIQYTYFDSVDEAEEYLKKMQSEQ